MGVTGELDEIPLSTTIIIVNPMKNKGKRVYLIHLQTIVRNYTALAFRKNQINPFPFIFFEH